MRTTLLLGVLGAAFAACGGGVMGGGADPGAGPGEPHDVASVRLFDSTGGELTFHMPLFDSVQLRVVVRMYAANGRYLTSVTGGQDMQFTFTPEGLASSTPVTGQPLARDVLTVAPPGTVAPSTSPYIFPPTPPPRPFGALKSWYTDAAAVAVVITVLASASPVSGYAQHEHEREQGTLGIPSTRMGSGTAWLPDAAPLPGYHASAGRWTVMVHGNVFLQYDRQFGTRADDQLGSVNWLMAVAGRPAVGGTLRFRAMVSAEPWTVTARGYPQLLQVAEPYRGGIVTDRQHPHDVVSEAAVMYEHTVGTRVAGSLYAALVGEPALGPVTYLHRPSAAFDPVTPLGHHSQDVTHTSFGVVTVGVFTRSLRVEASSFNGAHPDEDRTNFDPVRLDSYATRVSWNPGAEWSAAAWFGHLAASGGAHVHDALDRFGASVVRTHGSWSTALVYGADLAAGAGHPLNTLLLETTFELNEVNAVYGRAEYVRRTAADLALIGSVSRELDIGAVSVGYERRVWRRAPVAAGLGARGTLNLVPEELRPFYGSRTPAGLVAYLQLRPNARM